MYSKFLEETLPQFLKDVPLATKILFCFMHDSEPPHFCLSGKDFLAVIYVDHWISQGGQKTCPALFPVFKPLDFSMRLSEEFGVCEFSGDFGRLGNRINAACNSIRNITGKFETVRQQIDRNFTCPILFIMFLRNKGGFSEINIGQNILRICNLSRNHSLYF